MRFTEETFNPSTHVIAVVGELDARCGNRLIQRIAEVEVAYGDRVVLDLTDLSFMDSGGLRGVIDAWLAATDDHASFALVVPRGGRSRRVFELTGMLDRLEVVDTRSQALAG
jgi:anti-sigma B factor antagonist